MTGPFRSFRDIPQITSAPSWGMDVEFGDIEAALARWRDHHPGGIELEPDFQRGHVWSEHQQIAFVEYALRGGLERSGGTILFNSPGWMEGTHDGTIQLVDGLQRLTAILRFLRDEIPAFGQLRSEYEGYLGHSRRFRFAVNDLPTREAVLGWYLDLNAGGIAHSPEEIARVRQLREEALEDEPSGPKP